MIPTFGLLALFISYIHASPIAIAIPAPQPQPQAVTASLAPSQPPQPGCTGTYNGIFGIAVMNIGISVPGPSSSTSTSSTSSPSSFSSTSTGNEVESNEEDTDANSASISTMSCAADNAAANATPSISIVTMAEVSQIGDGQVQGGMHTVGMTMTMPVPVTMVPVSQIGDGQIQNPGSATTVTATSPTTAATAAAANDHTTLLPSSAPPTPTRRSVIVTSKPPTVLEQACGIETRGSTPSTLTASTAAVSAFVASSPMQPSDEDTGNGSGSEAPQANSYPASQIQLSASA
ncbi:hypothetical protein KCU88_g3462, partial [Aureobasidium melanogenum]